MGHIQRQSAPNDFVEGVRGLAGLRGEDSCTESDAATSSPVLWYSLPKTWDDGNTKSAGGGGGGGGGGCLGYLQS